jgi:hypothetical protein
LVPARDGPPAGEVPDGREPPWAGLRAPPPRPASFQRSTDPGFGETVREVVGQYRDPPEQVGGLGVDEKPPIPARIGGHPSCRGSPGLQRGAAPRTPGLAQPACSQPATGRRARGWGSDGTGPRSASHCWSNGTPPSPQPWRFIGCWPPTRRLRGPRSCEARPAPAGHPARHPHRRRVAPPRGAGVGRPDVDDAPALGPLHRLGPRGRQAGRAGPGEREPPTGCRGPDGRPDAGVPLVILSAN